LDRPTLADAQPLMVPIPPLLGFRDNARGF
jgi:hypothetical protein